MFHTRRHKVLNWDNMNSRDRSILVAENLGWQWYKKMLIPPQDDPRLRMAAFWKEGLPHWFPHYATNPDANREIIKHLSQQHSVLVVVQKIDDHTYKAHNFDNPKQFQTSHFSETDALCKFLLMVNGYTFRSDQEIISPV